MPIIQKTAGKQVRLDNKTHMHLKIAAAQRGVTLTKLFTEVCNIILMGAFKVKQNVSDSTAIKKQQHD